MATPAGDRDDFVGIVMPPDRRYSIKSVSISVFTLLRET